jgi:hypothetical protein
LEVQDKLAERFILGVQECKGFGFVLGAQGMLFARDSVLAVINARSPKQDESCFYN